MRDEEWRCSELEISMVGGTQIRVPGKVRLSAIGDVEVLGTVRGMGHLDHFADGAPIRGVTEDGLFVVEAAGCSPMAVDFDSTTMESTVRFAVMSVELLTTAGGLGPETRFEASLKSVVVVGSFSVVHEGISFTTRSLPNANDRRPGVIRAVMSADGAPTDDALTDLLLLLSLAQRCMIVAPARRAFVGDRLVRVTLHPNAEPHVAGHPLVRRTAAELESFFVQALPNFVANKGAYELARLVQYYCLSVSNPYAEVKFILASVFMEALKFYWALNVAGKPRVLKANGQVRGFERARNRNGDPVLYSFEDLLSETAAALGCAHTYTFIEDRNALFHSGAPGAYQRTGGSTWAAIKPELVSLYRQIDDLLLRIVGYRGPIHRWDDPDGEEMFG